MSERRDLSDESGIPKPPTSTARGQTVIGPFAVLAQMEKRHASLIVVQGAEIGREYRLRRTESIVGREEGVGIRVLDERVSRHHALLSIIPRTDGGIPDIRIKDLGSTNRTYVNGETIGEKLLRDGDKIQVGDTVLKFVLQDDVDARFHEEVRNRIVYDQLTGLLNKESLYLALESELRRCLSHGLPLSILMMDLDHFKLVNDTHGHLMGSFVLAEVGRIISEKLRSTDVSARYGGEEFLAYLAEIPIGEAGLVAERIRQAMEAHAFTRTMESGSELTISVTISIGVSVFPEHGRTRDELIAAADQALYRAKGEGRNRVCLA
jgi:diguanylate cyclase (GGDEF)-like protein